MLAPLAIATALLAACAAGPTADQRPGEEAIWTRDLLHQVATLASRGMEGRAAGSAGAAKAADYIAREFQQAGLHAGGEAGSYLQPFDLVTEIRLGQGNRLELTTPGQPSEPREYRPWGDFLPIAFSEEGEVQGQAIFVGYGISAPELGYDDYAGIDARGKVALMMTHGPREQDQHGPFRAAEAFHYSTNRYKVINAREHGAAAVLLVTDPNNHPSEEESVLPLRGASGSGSGIPALSVMRRVADAILAATGATLSQLQQEIDHRLAPKSFPVPGAAIRGKVALRRERGTTANVVGILPGRDPLRKEEAGVIGAHYDHLGFGGGNSLAPAAFNVLHPGADDNASGTSSLITLARALAAARGATRTFIFVAFSGEELGLLGSYHYVRQPPIPVERTVAMINLDAVGRMQKRRVFVQGVGSGEGLREIVEEASHGLGLDLTLRDDGFGPSDHTPFYAKERPVLHFFTGPHVDYHRPSDTIDKIDGEGLRAVTILAYRTAIAIANHPAAIAYRRTKGAAPAVERGERTGGYRPYFGSIPDFSESATPGVLLGGVRPESPAEQAGLKAGDIIVNFDGIQVRNLQDLIFAIRTKRPGDRVEVTYLRAGKEQRTQATLHQRQ